MASRPRSTRVARAARHHLPRCLRKGFDREHNTFLEFYGSKLLDASILLLPAVGFLPAEDPRVAGTIAAIEKHMMRDGFVLRHDPRETRGAATDRGRFSRLQPMASRRLCACRQIEKAQALFDRVAGVANDVGLIAEESDPGEGRQTGNFPQALTHIALINTAHNLCEAKKPAEKPVVQRAK